MKSMTLITVLLTALTASPLAWSGERINHNEIFALRDAGQILSMEELLNQIQISQLQPGQVLEAELERERGIYVYELKILDTDGTLYKLYMDAADGTLIERKTRD